MIKGQFPNFSLEDKTIVDGGSNVTHQSNWDNLPKPKVWKKKLEEEGKEKKRREKREKSER
ncbi:hypothetical protein OSB04_013185 [Centaurea solstitialis]|uniref:Uncharacterized protein n=1 Tax=Centaurea solstitialis TaxID=347529 RepID=A0AA38TQP7_9ASTR|nr:hypothetical protein OSB04_013185 [Centaurea solstitialis]